MRRLLATMVVLSFLALAGLAVWRAYAARLTPFILPDATHLVVTQSRLHTIEIRYHADPQTWRRRLSRQLIRAGWSEHTYTNPGATLPQWAFVNWYTRDTSIGPLALHEHAQFVVDRADASAVHLQIKHEIVWRGRAGWLQTYESAASDVPL